MPAADAGAMLAAAAAYPHPPLIRCHDIDFAADMDYVIFQITLLSLLYIFAAA